MARGDKMELQMQDQIKRSTMALWKEKVIEEGRQSDVSVCSRAKRKKHNKMGVQSSRK